MYKRKDGFYRLAKQQGYRSRASFKLIQLNHSYNIIRTDNNVLDIGAAPGGWMQVIAGITGGHGTVVGIDLLNISPFSKINAVTIKGDINDPVIRQKACDAISGKFDVVVSDLSINLTGDASSDTYKNFEMAKSIISFLPDLLKKGGNFLIKLFYCNDLKPFLKQVNQYVRTVSITKPKASRGASSELYMIGKGFSGGLRK